MRLEGLAVVRQRCSAVLYSGVQAFGPNWQKGVARAEKIAGHERRRWVFYPGLGAYAPDPGVP